MPDISELVARQAARELRKRMDHFDPGSLIDRIPRQALLESSIVREVEQRAEGRGFLGGFVAGALVGAILALIFAPRRGAETRDFIVHKASDVSEKVSSTVNETRDEVIANIRETASSGIEQASGAIADARETVKDAIAEVTHQAEAGGDETKSDGERASDTDAETAGA